MKKEESKRNKEGGRHWLKLLNMISFEFEIKSLLLRNILWLSVLGQRLRSCVAFQWVNTVSYEGWNGIFPFCVLCVPTSEQEQGTACNIHQPLLREAPRLRFRRAIAAVTPVSVLVMHGLSGWICWMMHLLSTYHSNLNFPVLFLKLFFPQPVFLHVMTQEWYRYESSFPEIRLLLPHISHPLYALSPPSHTCHFTAVTFH